VWVHCASGFRAAIGASLLDRAGRRVVHIDDDWDRAAQLGLPVVAED
jgi:rhodanese-related sulfurtransferase